MRIKLIANPAAGFSRIGKFLPKIRKILGTGHELDIEFTRKPFDSFHIAELCAREGFDLLVASGGDGTANEAVNGLMAAGRRIPIGFIPLGTSNAYALSLGIPLDPVKACEVILRRKTKRVDLGKARGVSGARYFLTMAGAGYDAQSIRHIHPAVRKHLGGVAAHFLAGAYCLIFSDRAKLTVEIDGLKTTAYQVCFFNGKYLGGAVKAAPEADMTDGLLDVFLFKKGSKREAIRYISRIVGGSRRKFQNIDRFKAGEVKISSSEEVFVHVDGELSGVLPQAFEVCPAVLDAVVP